MSKIKIQDIYLPSNGYHDWQVRSYNDDIIDYVEQKQGIFFTQEEYNNHIKEIIEDTLKTAANKVDEEDCFAYSSEHNRYDLVEESITSTFQETFDKFKL
jgi:hypothetical protein